MFGQCINVCELQIEIIQRKRYLKRLRISTSKLGREKKLK